MDPLAVFLGQEEPEASDSQDDAKQPKEKKKKMSASMAKKIQAKLAEEARLLHIKQRQEYLRETKERVQREWERNHAKAEVFQSEYESRSAQLESSFKRLSEIEDAWNEYLEDLREKQNWSLYLDCRYLPNPTSIPQINSYLFVWREMETSDQMSFCLSKIEEVMQLLNGLQEILANPRPYRPPEFLEELKNLRNEIRLLLQDNIDRATFYLFSRIETDMEPINVTTSKYIARCPYFIMSLWAELMTPIPSTKGKEVRHPLKVFFEETEILVVVPVGLLDVRKVIRSMWLNYDHWSDRCRTYDCPPVPEYYKLNLLELFVSNYEKKTEIMNIREKQEIITKKKVAGLPPEPALSQEILAWEGEPQRALSDEINFRECEEEDDLGKQIKAVLNEFEVNLRERTILGSLLLVEIIHLPTQPKYMRFKHNVTLREEEPKLHQVEFQVKYPPPIDDFQEKYEDDGNEGFKEDPKLEKRKLDADLQEELKKLVVIELRPCGTVVWFEKPQVAHWDSMHGYWSTEDIHDIEYDEEEETIRFKTGRLGLIGFHVGRFCNIPYEDWIFEPDEEGGVKFFLKTYLAEFTFKIKEGLVSLEWMKNVPSKAMNWIYGVYFTPVKLMEVMKKGGIDVFPAPDAASYLENIESKHMVVENNVYQVWGLFSSCFRFKKSKFNQFAGRINIVFQAQEIYKNNQVDYCLIQTAMCSSYVLDINENSSQYSSERAQYSDVCVDLYSLLYKNCTMNAKRYSDVTSYLLVQTVREFMGLIRPISFS